MVTSLFAKLFYCERANIAHIPICRHFSPSTALIITTSLRLLLSLIDRLCDEKKLKRLKITSFIDKSDVMCQVCSRL